MVVEFRSTLPYSFKLPSGGSLDLKSLTILAGIIPSVFIVYMMITTSHVRHEIIDGQMMKAWYVNLPGMGSVNYPQQTADLNKWAGSTVNGLEIAVDGERHPELEAAAALKSMGLFQDYVIKKIDGQWTLYRPERTKRYFTVTAHYRISRFKPVD
ncbi:MAG: hypothetical protein UX41_C0018G0009 [Candidatus Collierbacteria bacterium GW2011_GWE1_46_18]|uniref:Uncharacterized protein n=1 Tax=Candidatus Collierbacteria bacterium GW2011_GWE1_46_18 TaxID=1618399 RepID=A0A0G1P9X3_9BACT|nr:MAG: hypothetical protein UX41_C0018G0009 [Candidatus Collierbacteria bacterium GW2011_GWE1_46_18]